MRAVGMHMQATRDPTLLTVTPPIPLHPLGEMGGENGGVPTHYVCGPYRFLLLAPHTGFVGGTGNLLNLLPSRLEVDIYRKRVRSFQEYKRILILLGGGGIVINTTQEYAGGDFLICLFGEAKMMRDSLLLTPFQKWPPLL